MHKSIVFLAAVAGLLALQEFAGSAVQDLFFREVKLNHQALSKSSKQLRLKERSLRQIEVAIAKFNDRAKMSLNGDSAKASIEYQEYLVKLTEACALAPVMISSSQPERLEDLGHVLHFSVQATGTTEQFGRLLDGLHQTDALHRLSHVNIFQSLGPDSPTHSITLDIALMVLDAASGAFPQRTIKPPPANKMSDLFSGIDIFRRPSFSDPNSGSFNTLLSNIFQNLPTPAPEVQEPTVVPEPIAPQSEPVFEKPDPRSHVRLVGIIQRDDKKYAMFFNLLDNQQQACEEESALEGLGVSAKVARISQTDVWLVLDDNELRLPIGGLLNEAVKE